MIGDKSPLHYTTDYLNCKTKQERQAVADSVPEHLKALVKLNIKLNRDQAKWKKK